MEPSDAQIAAMLADARARTEANSDAGLPKRREACDELRRTTYVLGNVASVIQLLAFGLLALFAYFVLRTWFDFGVDIGFFSDGDAAPPPACAPPAECLPGSGTP